MHQVNNLYEICSKLFLYLVSFNRRARRGDHMDLATVRNEVDALFVEQETLARQNPQFLPAYQSVEYALAATVDEVLINSRWQYAQDWEDGSCLVEFRKFRTRVAGVEFWERLRKVPDNQADVLEAYYCCLLVGFRGIHRADRDEFIRQRNTLYLRLQQRMTRDERVLCPKAYEHTLTRDFTKPAMLSLLKLAVVAIGFVVIYLIAGRVAWEKAIEDIRASSQRLIQFVAEQR